MLRRVLSSVSVLLALLFTARAANAQSGSIVGKVTEAESGAPVALALVAAQRAGGAVAAQATTREDGSYRLVNLSPGTYTIVVGRIGYANIRTENVQVTAGGTATLDVRLNAIVVQLNPVVTTASRKEEKALDAPASVAVIDVREIEQRTAPTVADHLEGMAGVNISKNGVVQSNIVARGFNNAFSGSILTLQDYRFAGVPSLRVNVPFLFTATNEDIERVEVLLGPASALYGPNSANGVLHLITKSPFTSQGTTLTLDGGTRSLLRVSGRHAGLVGNKVGFKLSGEYFRAKDWEYEDPGEPDVFPASAPAGRAGQENNRDFDISRTVGEARLDIRPTDNSEFVTTVGMTRIGSGFEYTGANGTAYVKNWTYTSLQQRGRIGRLFGQVFANLSDAGNENGQDLSGTYLLRSGQPIVDQSRVFAAQIQHGVALGSWQDFVYGLDYIKTEPRTGNTINGRNEDIDEVTEVGGYVQSTTKLGPKVDFIGALRIDNNNQIEDNAISPRAALIFKPTQDQNFRVTFNRAFSTPANFSFFLDLIQAANVGGTPFNVRALGNPPKQGWTFNRSCAGGLCMKSPFNTASPNTWVPVVTSPFYQGAVAALRTRLIPALAAALQQGGVPAQQATAIATNLVNLAGSLTPNPTQVGAQLRFLGSPTTASVNPSNVRDIEPLGASYNNTFEVGYKGILGNKLRLAIDLWTQTRGDVGNPAGLATPNVFIDASTAASFLSGPFIQALVQGGFPQQQAQVIGPQLAAGVAGGLTQLPLGVVTFNNDRFASPTDVYATYTSSGKEIRVNGMDLAVDYVMSDRVALAGTYSWVSDLVFDNVVSSNGLALMLNAPDHKASAAIRYRDETRGWGWDLRTRYFNAYPVNSGVYATGFSFPRPGVNQTYRYEDIEASTLFDVSFNKRFRVAGATEFLWAINGDNIFNTPYRTLPGAPRIGRTVTTKVQYTF